MQSTTSDLNVILAVRDVLLNNTGIAQTSHLAQQANAGATSVFVPPGDATKFVQQGVFSFDDRLEPLPWLPIAEVNDTTGEIQLDFGAVTQFPSLGYPTAGLQAQHAVNTRVYTNLVALTPIELDPMIQSGLPAAFITIPTDAASIQATQRVNDVMAVHIQYHRRASRIEFAGGQEMDANFFGLSQEFLSRKDLWAIRQAILNNRHLLDNTGTPTAQKLGRPNSRDAWITTDFRKVATDADTWQYIASLTVIVTDRGTQLRPLSPSQ